MEVAGPLGTPLGPLRGLEGVPGLPAHLRMRPVSRGNSRRATWVGPQAERPRFPGPLLSRRGQGPHLGKRWEPCGFSRVAAGFSSYDGDLSLPLGLALGSPIFPSGCEGKLGVALESLRFECLFSGRDLAHYSSVPN